MKFLRETLLPQSQENISEDTKKLLLVLLKSQIIDPPLKYFSS